MVVKANASSVSDGRITEDAPEEHPVWRVKIKLDSSNASLGAPFPDGERGKPKKFSVSTAKAGSEDARRIFRLCGAQLLDGRPRADVEQLRTLLCNRCVGKDEADTTDICANWARAAAPLGEPLSMSLTDATPIQKAPQDVATQAVTPKSSPAPKAAAKEAEPAQPALKVEDLEDAPPESAAHQKVRTELKRGTCFFITPDATKKRFQTTIHAAGKSQEAAERIARACYHRFEQGATREEVEQFKQECYKRLGGGFVRSGSGIPSVESKQPAAKKRPKPSEGEAVLQRLQEQGKLDGAIQVSGRDSSKKNSTVNGIYVRVEGGYNGQPAFERIKIGGDDAKRCLYYAKDKSRWKLGEELGVSKHFAYLKVKDDGKKLPSEVGSKLYWHFFDGADSGWTEDREVKCNPYDQGKRARRENGEAGNADQKPNQDVVEVVGSVQDSVVQDSSDSEASSSSRGESDSEEDSASSGGSKSTSPRKGTAAAAAVPVAAQGPGPRTKMRACAKMLVRAGLRCSCHFSYIQDCPSRRKTPAA